MVYPLLVLVLMLKVEKLSVEVEKKKVLEGINLTIGGGEVHALLGPNASGKSTLARAIMGFPNVKVTGGRILFGRKEITRMPIEERAKLGLALVFQHPPAVKGVKLSRLLEEVFSARLGTGRYPARRGKPRRVDAEEFNLGSNLLGRDVNVGFSGGERKLAEIVQVVSMNPRFVILDELDAGLDPKNLEKIAEVVRDRLLADGVSLLMITHRGDILRFLKPEMVHVMLDGRIISSSDDWQQVWETIRKYDYEKCRRCPFAEGGEVSPRKNP